MREELSDESHVLRRILVEHRGGIGCKPIGFFGLCGTPVDGEIVAKHSDAFLCAMAERRDRVRSGFSGSDVGENFELDGYACTNIKNAGVGAQGTHGILWNSHPDTFALAGTDKKYIERLQDRVTSHKLARML